ncbi:mis18-binding protein 1 isoform X2 [Plectropomus leopardus]|uniref:mis18-binding protein 1 isoform X2 n=1 Tax=Plectropomus leopardus TaxID=160734 RepID=UPI001C4B9251|nr:mis18-binding protein 1 isoform X2 [Plectropomus leopardus]
MASYHHLLQHTKSRFESPAKVFAKLKSKVRREEMCAKDGTFTAQDPLCNVTEKHGAGFGSPRKRAESTWVTEELKENQRTTYYRHEAQALTLSPIKSPQKSFAYSNISRNAEEMPPVTERGHGSSPRKRAFVESVALSSLVDRKQIHTETPQIRDTRGFRVTSGTPVKIHPVENEYVDSVFEEGCAPLDKLMSPVYMCSPMRKRLRRSKWESQEFNRVSSSTKEVSSGPTSQPQERKTSSALSEDIHTHVEDMGNFRGPEMDKFTHEPALPSPRAIRKKRCFVPLETLPPMSPAKMFAYLKERESKKEQQEVHKVSSSTRDLFDAGDNLHQRRDTPPSTAHSVGEMEDVDCRGAPESVVPVSRSRVESADSQSDTDPSEDVPSPAVSPQCVLFEDPLVLNTPRISIPKKQEAVFKPNRWPQRTKFPSESVIYLKKWFLRKNHKGLFVDGVHRDDNIPWNSNIIVDRVSKSVVKTVSGRVYILVGKMNKNIESEFPKWLLKKFANGFPPDWEALYERFLSESKDDPNRETERNTQGRVVISRLKSEASSINHSVKQHRQKSLRAPDSCPPESMTSARVSRSGRVIKPPLEYWKGGRVILDAQMNVTIHECYDTSICIPVTTSVSTRASQKPVRVFLPCSEGRKQRESASDEETSVPLRKVKAPLRKHNRAKVKPDEKPSYSQEPPVETHSSTDEWSGRHTRSSQRRPAKDRTMHVDTVPQRQSKPEKSSTWRSKKQTHGTSKPSVRGRKHAVRASPESVNDRTSTSSPDEVVGRKKQRKEVHRERGRGAPKPRPNYVFPSSDSSQSSEEFKEELKKKPRVTQTKGKQSKRSKSSSPSKPSPKLTQSSKKPQSKKGNAPIPAERDDDEWTEAELVKLQEAVSYYPKHMTAYWEKVARVVGTRSAEECHHKHTTQGTSQTPAKKAKKPKKVEATKDPDDPVISARAGTFKRKQQVRQFLDNMPRDDVEDVFSSAYMQNKRFEMPSMCPSEHDFKLPDMEPLTPMSTGFPEVKTPQCLHITPGMMGSPSRNHDDKYVYQLQKRMKKNQFNVCKQAPSSKSFSPTPSVKRTMRRCGNADDTFVVWEMFPGNGGQLSDSEEEEDFYFSDKD